MNPAKQYLGLEKYTMTLVEIGDPEEWMRETVREIIRKKYVLRGLEIAVRGDVPVFM